MLAGKKGKGDVSIPVLEIAPFPTPARMTCYLSGLVRGNSFIGWQYDAAEQGGNERRVGKGIERDGLVYL